MTLRGAVLALYVLGVAAALGAIAGPTLWERSKVRGIRERYVRLHAVISGVEAYASDYKSYPFLTSCEALADVLSPNYLREAPCAEPGRRNAVGVGRSTLVQLRAHLTRS